MPLTRFVAVNLMTLERVSNDYCISKCVSGVCRRIGHTGDNRPKENALDSTVNNSVKRGNANSVTTGEFCFSDSAKCPISLDVLSRLWCYVRSPVDLSPLLNFIQRIIKILPSRPQPQMGRITTRSVVAARAVVAHLHAFWNISFVESKGCDVSTNNISGLILPTPDDAVSVLIPSLYPRPTSIWSSRFINARFKALSEGTGKALWQSRVLGAISIFGHITGLDRAFFREQWGHWITSAKPEMLRVDAGNVIAGGENLDVWVESAIVQQKGQSASAYVARTLTASQGSSISAFIPVTNPVPAVVGFDKAGPKSVNNAARQPFFGKHWVGVKLNWLKRAVDLPRRVVDFVIHNLISLSVCRKLVNHRLHSVGDVERRHGINSLDGDISVSFSVTNNADSEPVRFWVPAFNQCADRIIALFLCLTGVLRSTIGRITLFSHSSSQLIVNYCATLLGHTAAGALSFYPKPSMSVNQLNL